MHIMKAPIPYMFNWCYRNLLLNVNVLIIGCFVTGFVIAYREITC